MTLSNRTRLALGSGPSLLADWRFDDIRSLGNALALLVGDLAVRWGE